MCNASPAADSVPALIAAGAKVAIMGPLGERETPIEKLLSGPGKTFLKKGIRKYENWCWFLVP